MTNDEALKELLHFAKEAMVPLVIGGVLGGFAAGAWLAITPHRYEARALFEMAQLGRMDPSGRTSTERQTEGVLVESPMMLAQRLRSPASYTPATFEPCDVRGESDPGEFLAQSVVAIQPRGLPNALEISVQMQSRSSALQCVGAVFEMIREQQGTVLRERETALGVTLEKLQHRLDENEATLGAGHEKSLPASLYWFKRDEMAQTQMEKSAIEALLRQSQATRLVAPAYAWSEPAYPRQAETLLGGSVAGLILGALVGYLRRAKQRLRP